MFTDPLFIILAIIATLIAGVAKGGFGGGIVVMAVPLLALSVSPVQAAAIMLPILVVIDIVTLISYRRSFDKKLFVELVPPALVGIAIGYLTTAYVSDNHVRLIVGVVAFVFTIDYFLRKTANDQPKQKSLVRGSFWLTCAGFTSFFAHAGGPPYAVYTLPLKMDKRIWAGTTSYIFSVMNAVKLIPYAMLGQFSTDNLTVSAMLFPIAIAGTLLGVWLVKVVSQTFFYRITYAGLFLLSLKLIYDGLYGLELL